MDFLRTRRHWRQNGEKYYGKNEVPDENNRKRSETRPLAYVFLRPGHRHFERSAAHNQQCRQRSYQGTP